MNDLPVDAVIVGLVASTTQFLKPYLELRLKPTDVLHDSSIQLLAVLLALGFRLLEFGVPLTGPDVITLLGYGIGTGATAVGVYHLVSTVTSKAPTDPTPPPVDYAALAASLAPVLARLVPAVPAYTFPAMGNPPAVPLSGAGDQRGTAVAPEPAPQSPSPVPVAPATPPA